MTKPKPLCPIPKSIVRGTVAELRGGELVKFHHWDLDGSAWFYPSLRSLSGGRNINQDGSHYFCNEERDCIKLIRSTPPAPKPKRQDKDAAWLLKMIEPHLNMLPDQIVKNHIKRLRAIAARLQKLADSGETK